MKSEGYEREADEARLNEGNDSQRQKEGRDAKGGEMGGEWVLSRSSTGRGTCRQTGGSVHKDIARYESRERSSCICPLSQHVTDTRDLFGSEPTTE